MSLAMDPLHPDSYVERAEADPQEHAQTLARNDALAESKQ